MRPTSDLPVICHNRVPMTGCKNRCILRANGAHSWRIYNERCSMKRRFWVGTTLAAMTLLFSSIPSGAQDYSAKYSGFQEVGGLGGG